MTPAQIRKRYATINAAHWKWANAERDLQALCQHPSATKVNKGDTGNWDRSQDSYWRECKCPDCGKQWNEDQ